MEWISVTEKLPDRHINTVVLFKYKKGLPTYGIRMNCIDNVYGKDEWVFEPEEIEITHWIYLPPVPKDYQCL